LVSSTQPKVSFTLTKDQWGEWKVENGQGKAALVQAVVRE